MNYFPYRPLRFEYRDGKWVHNWFSNMIEAQIEIDGITYRSVENYYQAMKVDVSKHFEYAQITPQAAKYKSRQQSPPSNWHQIKDDVMLRALNVKWRQPNWKALLLATEDDMIIEWNNWGDKYWGVSIVDNQGENRLGKMLMLIRKNIRETDEQLRKISYGD